MKHDDSQDLNQPKPPVSIIEDDQNLWTEMARIIAMRYGATSDPTRSQDVG